MTIYRWVADVMNQAFLVPNSGLTKREIVSAVHQVACARLGEEAVGPLTTYMGWLNHKKPTPETLDELTGLEGIKATILHKYLSVANFCRVTGIKIGTANEILNDRFRLDVIENGLPNPHLDKILLELDETFERFFPEYVGSLEDTPMYGHPVEAPSPEEDFIARQKQQKTEGALESLADREKKALEMYFGLGEQSTDHTLEEVGNQIGVSGNRIREIKAKALRKLRNPKLDGVDLSGLVEIPNYDQGRHRYWWPDGGRVQRKKPFTKTTHAFMQEILIKAVEMQTGWLMSKAAAEALVDGIREPVPADAFTPSPCVIPNPLPKPPSLEWIDPRGFKRLMKWLSASQVYGRPDIDIVAIVYTQIERAVRRRTDLKHSWHPLTYARKIQSEEIQHRHWEVDFYVAVQRRKIQRGEAREYRRHCLAILRGSKPTKEEAPKLEAETKAQPAVTPEEQEAAKERLREAKKERLEARQRAKERRQEREAKRRKEVTPASKRIRTLPKATLLPVADLLEEYNPAYLQIGSHIYCVPIGDGQMTMLEAGQWIADKLGVKPQELLHTEVEQPNRFQGVIWQGLSSPEEAVA